MWFWYHKSHRNDKKRLLIVNIALLHKIGDQNLLDIYFDQVCSKQKYIYFLIVEQNYTKCHYCWYFDNFPNLKTLAFQIESSTLTHKVGVVCFINRSVSVGNLHFRLEKKNIYRTSVANRAKLAFKIDQWEGLLQLLTSHSRVNKCGHESRQGMAPGG